MRIYRGMQEKARVRGLIFAFAKYQRHFHLRHYRSYGEDLESITKLDNVEKGSPLDPAHNATISIIVSEVVGDTIISTALWIAGAKKGGFDFYDTCIVILRVEEKIITIPAARVLTGMKPSTASELEDGKDRLRPPRGLGTAAGSWNAWCYWIPCGHNRWLFFTSSKMKIKGPRQAVVMTDNEVTAQLEKGDLFVSLRSVDEIKEIVGTSRTACRYLLRFLDDPQDV
jgi:hypothetical protein